MKIKIKIKTENEILDFVNMMNTFTSKIELSGDKYTVNAKSIIGVITLKSNDNDLYVNLISSNENEIVRFNREIKLWME